MTDQELRDHLAEQVAGNLRGPLREVVISNFKAGWDACEHWMVKLARAIAETKEVELSRALETLSRTRRAYGVTDEAEVDR